MRARRECGSSLLPCVKVSDGFAKGFGFVTFLICTLDSRAACPSTRVILIFAGARFFLPTERRETRDERDRRTQRVCYSGCHFKLGFLAPYHTFNSALFSIKKMMSCIRAAASKSFQSTKQGARRWVHVEKRLEELGITLPKPSSPRANYNIVCRSSGNMMYISGHLPFKPDGTLMTGRIGEGDLDKDYGYQAARHAGLNIISTLKEQLGDLDRVEQVVKVRYFSFCIF